MMFAPRLILLATVAGMLSACSGGWWGAEDSTPPLPGDRLSVLAYDQQVQVDPDLGKTPLTLPPPQASDAWPTAGGGADHAGGHAALGADLKKAWSADVGEGASLERPLIPTPVVAGGVIFTMDSGTGVRAFSLDKGQELWRVDLAPKAERGEATGGGLAFDQGRLFVATGYGEVFALNPADGTTLWRQSVASPVRSAPAPGPGVVLVVTIDNRLVALSTETGAVQWRHAGILETAGLLGAPSPAVHGDTVLVAYSSGELFAVRAANGREQWADNLAALRREGGVLSIAAIRGQPVLAAGGVAAVAISNSGRLVAIDTRSGQRVWDQRVSGSQMPWVAGSTVFVVTNQAQLMALNLSDGRIRWVVQLDQWENPDKREGLIAWYGPVLAGGRLWLTNSDGRLRGYDPATGAEAVDLRLKTATNRPPIVVGNTLYTLDDKATLTAWR